MKLEDFRRSYSLGKLTRADLNNDPVQQFEKWLQEILATDIKDPTAMVVATVDEQGCPNQRYVLLKSVNEQGFVFFTDTTSTKGQEIASNPRVSLLFPWHQFERQVRVQGVASRLSEEDVAHYFHSRPIGSQLAAYSSEQSAPISSRSELVERFESNQESLGDDVPLPERWGGYRIKPESFEFWQGGEHRLHDRFRYQLMNAEWSIERLQP